MNRIVSRWRCLGVMVCTVSAAPVFAQGALRPELQQPISQSAPTRSGELHGVVHDESGQPLVGAVVSALGSTSAFAISDRHGRFAFRNLPAGPYLVRAHLQGYHPARGRVIQINPDARNPSTIALTRRGDPSDETPNVLVAGIGGASEATAPAAKDEHDHGEVAWRLRHTKRSVLKDAEHAVADFDSPDSLFEDSLSSIGRAVGSPARLASALFADLAVSGQFNLLTTTSFDRPQDLFSMSAAEPRGVAYLALEVPGPSGDWMVRGTITEGDLASWILAGSYVRHAPAAHAYEAGVSYSMQRYLGGNAEALAAMRDGSRNVGSMYAYDSWTVTPHLRVGYGAKYASYDYLDDPKLFSPRASVTIQPTLRDSLKLRATVMHTEIAPGAEEFLPPEVGLWLPPERTFSHVSRAAFRPERLDHVELGAERMGPAGIVMGVRAFRQRVDDQVVTLFGVAVADSPANVGHYHVGSAGGFEARGWGVTLSRTVSDRVTASVDYSQAATVWQSQSPDVDALAGLTASVVRERERIHDLTASVESVVAPTATRLLIVYKMNSAFAASDLASGPTPGTRFDVQVNQALPFLNFTSTQWEMLVAVSNLFHDELAGGSVYDELLVVRPPKRVLGGVTVRF